MITATLDAKKVQKALKQIQNEIKHPKKLLRAVGERETRKAQNRIAATKMNPDDQAWAPWAYATLRRRIREGNASQGLLYRTGSLLRSFAWRATRKTVKIFTKIPYAKYLQYGTSKMPAREILGWGKDSLETLPKATKKMIQQFWN